MKKTSKAPAKKSVGKSVSKKSVSKKPVVLKKTIIQKKSAPKKINSSSLVAWFGGIVGLGIALYPSIFDLNEEVRQFFFLGGAIALLLTAIVSRQRVFIILQSVLVASAFMGFLTYIPYFYSYTFLILIVGFALGNLITDRYCKRDKWAFLGIVGFASLSFAFSGMAPSVQSFNLLMAVGSIFIAVYALARVLFHKEWISLIWFVLNLFFCINPVLFLISLQ